MRLLESVKEINRANRETARTLALSPPMLTIRIRPMATDRFPDRMFLQCHIPLIYPGIPFPSAGFRLPSADYSKLRRCLDPFFVQRDHLHRSRSHGCFTILLVGMFRSLSFLASDCFMDVLRYNALLIELRKSSTRVTHNTILQHTCFNQARIRGASFVLLSYTGVRRYVLGVSTISVNTYFNI